MGTQQLRARQEREFDMNAGVSQLARVGESVGGRPSIVDKVSSLQVVVPSWITALWPIQHPPPTFTHLFRRRHSFRASFL